MSSVVVRPSPLVDEPAPHLLLRVGACKQAMCCACSWPTSPASTDPMAMLMHLPLFADEHCGGFSEYVFVSCYVPADRPRSRHPAASRPPVLVSVHSAALSGSCGSLLGTISQCSRMCLMLASHLASYSLYSVSVTAGDSGLAVFAQSRGLCCSSVLPGSAIIARRKFSRCSNACFLPLCHEPMFCRREQFSRRSNSTSAVKHS